MKYIIYNQKGEEAGTTLLPKEIFDIKENPDLIYQVVVSQMSNKRKGLAHTKDRSEVRGGGIKPWQQKGTGRARAGSIRSPLWKGGGVTFGPRKEKKFNKIIPKKIRRKALFIVLAAKAKENLLIILDKLKVEKPKTKEIFKILKKFPCQGKNCLVALPNIDKNLILAARNLPKIKIIEARNLNCLDLLSFKYLLMPKETIKIIKEIFTK
jgi:large subunit ribosomal protein L4